LSSEKKAAVREFEDKKVYLKEQLIAELEEKQKMIEQVPHLSICWEKEINLNSRECYDGNAVV
jgi:hypothetical protein